MTHTKDAALKLAAEFDKRFTSMNGIDVPERVSVPRDEWRALNAAIKQALAAQPAPSQYGSPELQALVVARAIEKDRAAQPTVPDAMTSADIQEHIEYVAGWNDCRQAMLEMMK